MRGALRARPVRRFLALVVAGVAAVAVFNMTRGGDPRPAAAPAAAVTPTPTAPASPTVSPTPTQTPTQTPQTPTVHGVAVAAVAFTRAWLNTSPGWAGRLNTCRCAYPDVTAATIRNGTNVVPHDTIPTDPDITPGAASPEGASLTITLTRGTITVDVQPIGPADAWVVTAYNYQDPQ